MESPRLPSTLKRFLPWSVLAVLVSACAPEGPPSEPAKALSPCLAGSETTPNVLLIVVDTLRADRLTFYGHDRETSPEMQARLADRGVVVEKAYAQAPWTLPSMAGLMTGLDPARLLDDNGNPWGIPEAADTLAEGLRERGFQTLAFVANPTLHEGNGFAQGFDHFETAPYDFASLALHADSLDAKLEAGTADLREPFFLYAHYLDPHDPYENPDLIDGRSPFFPDYEGSLRGTDVHGLYLGKVEMEDPERDVEHLKALYDSEILYVDKFIGRLLDRLGPERLARTLIILTSDHGEELYDHRGWKHGESVYEEQIRVPLVFRWDGVLPAGSRADTVARLVDVAPSVLDMVPGEVDIQDEARDLDGRSLWPILCGEESAPVPAFSRHHTEGPWRLARVDGHRKTILFDRESKDEPSSERGTFFLAQDRERMARLETYDLNLDPAESRQLEPDADHGWSVLEGLDPYLEGLRVFSQGTSAPLRGELVFGRNPTGLKRLFLSAEDTVELEGDTVRFHLTGEGIAKGFLVQGSLGELRWIRLEPSESTPLVRLGGRPLDPGTGSSAGLWELSVGLRELLVDELPRSSSGLQLWLRRPNLLDGRKERDAETERRLKALGYAD